MPHPAPQRTDGALRTAVVASAVGVLAVSLLRLALARSWVGAGQLLPWAAAAFVAGACCLVVATSRAAVLAARGLAAGGAVVALLSGAHGVGLAAGLALLATVGHPGAQRVPDDAGPPTEVLRDAVTSTRELPSVRVTEELPAVPAARPAAVAAGSVPEDAS